MGDSETRRNPRLPFPVQQPVQRLGRTRRRILQRQPRRATLPPHRHTPVIDLQQRAGPPGRPAARDRMVHQG